MKKSDYFSEYILARRWCQQHKDSQFFTCAQLHPAKKFSDLEQAIYQEFDNIRQKPITDAELYKVQNKFKSDFVSQQESVKSLADLFCFYTNQFWL